MSVFADYDTILERLSLGQLWEFPGGVHPEQHKKMSNEGVITTLPLPSHVYIPVKQHIGVEGEIVVSEGERVLKGQALTRNDNTFALPVHASSSGTVVSIGKHPAAHPSGLSELTICIELDNKDESLPTSGVQDYAKTDKNTIIDAICNAGISGMGGAGFPTHLKSNNVKPIEFLIINGIECEPYITADDRLMREHAWQIRQGIDILVHILSPKQVIVAIEDNKPEALETMAIACQQQSDYQVVSVPTKYPAGGEKQLIQVLCSREVPADGLPIDVGCMMYNVGTCYAIADAVMEGKPLTERVVTITGGAIDTPQNVWVPIGTPVMDLLNFAHYNSGKQSYPKIIMGGPMMGFTLASAKIPIIKTTNCILAPQHGELLDEHNERACIRCSACADACPQSLLPQQLFWYSKAKEYEAAQEYNLFDCIECGACAYVCPSEIPLVHYYRQAKTNIRQQKHEKEQSEKARIRFEARKERLQKEKLDREEKHRKAAEARKQAMNSDGGAAKDKIALALARAKAKKAAMNNDASPNTQQPDTASSETSSQKPSQSIKAETNTGTDDKKQKVAEAIARAKAKKLAQQAKPKETSDSKESVASENKPASVNDSDEANKKSGDNSGSNGEHEAIQDTTQEAKQEQVETDAQALKKQKIAAAIAKAKARKKAQANSNGSAAKGTSEDNNE